MLFSAFSSHRYDFLGDQNSGSELSEKLLESGQESLPEKRPQKQMILTLDKSKITCILLVWLLLTVGMNYWMDALRHPHDLSGIEMKQNEFAPVRSYIEKDVQTFTGTAVFEGPGVAYREYIPGIKQYIGDSPEVDANWHELIEDRYFWISEEEAKRHWPLDYQKYYHTPELGWSIGLDVFHTLHCVNRIRHALNKAKRNEHNNTAMETYHEDHCLDIIRQAIQCQGDLTPIPTRRFADGQHDHFIDSNQKHECRNIWTLRKFLEKRKIMDDEAVARVEESIGRKYVEEEHAMGVIGFPERNVEDFRPPDFKLPSRED